MRYTFNKLAKDFTALANNYYVLRFLGIIRSEMKNFTLKTQTSVWFLTQAN